MSKAKTSTDETCTFGSCDLYKMKLQWFICQNGFFGEIRSSLLSTADNPAWFGKWFQTFDPKLESCPHNWLSPRTPGRQRRSRGLHTDILSQSPRTGTPPQCISPDSSVWRKQKTFYFAAFEKGAKWYYSRPWFRPLSVCHHPPYRLSIHVEFLREQGM